MFAIRFVICSLLLPSLSSALSTANLPCQVQKAAAVSPLTGCPAGTIFVSATDKRANFTTVQSAVASLPASGNANILIGAGQYHETVNVTRKSPLTLLGQLNASCQTTPSECEGSNLVQIWNNQYVKSGQDDATSSVLVVAPNFNASLIGSGPTGAPLQPVFGNTDFKAYNIDFQNRAANYAISQALVTDISYANASFYGCTFASYQDTWYTGRNGSTYVIGGTIYGETDYLFGFGTAWFENVTFANRACGGGLVAWKGTNLTDAHGNRYGAYISNSQIIRSPDANSTAKTTGKCYLGRPWNDLATTVYLNTYMDASVTPAGFKPFGGSGHSPTILNTTFYAEYNSHGPGATLSQRVSADHILTAAQATNFTVAGVFLGNPNWVDFDYSL